jgi:hypothetical protein
MTEQAGAAAKTFIDALKDQPLSLALVVMNVALLGFLYYTSSLERDEHRHDTELLYENRKIVADLLVRCTLDKQPP